jgi:hypothetical protein
MQASNNTSKLTHKKNKFAHLILLFASGIQIVPSGLEDKVGVSKSVVITYKS